ncbi:MAG: LptF/LptG family permease [Taibaiella sp.]|nr:LptF/LptG family permease [Taibaiella sp.]
MKLLDKYILRQYIVSFLFAISILAVISCVVDYSEKVDAFVKNQAPVREILMYFVTFVPHIIALLYPLFIFISTIFFYQPAGLPLRVHCYAGRRYQDRENHEALPGREYTYRPGITGF